MDGEYLQAESSKGSLGLSDGEVVVFVCFFVYLPRSLYVELSSDCVLETNGHTEQVGHVILKS